MIRVEEDQVQFRIKVDAHKVYRHLQKQTSQPTRSHMLHSLFVGAIGLGDTPSGHLGLCPMPKPMSELLIKCNKVEKGYSFVACISAAVLNEDDDRYYKLKIDSGALANQFSTLEAGSAIYILENSGASEYVIECSAPVIEVSCGTANKYPTPYKKIRNASDFEYEFARFASLIETLVFGICKSARVKQPCFTLVIEPPKAARKSRGKRSRKKAPDQDLEQSSIFDMYNPFSRSRDMSTEKARSTMALKEKPSTRFADIGGMRETKESMGDVLYALQNPQAYKAWEAKPPSGVLLIGDPGVGKTSIVRALAGEADANFYYVKLTDFLSMWYSQSEKQLQEVIDEAKAKGKSLVFFDEIDAVAANRDHIHEASKRVVTVLQEAMSGLTPTDGVVFFGATNREHAIDPAILRAGRFSRKIYVPRPDIEAHKQILAVYKRKVCAEAGRNVFETNFDIEALAMICNGLSGADDEELMRRVTEEKVRQERLGRNPKLIGTEDFVAEVEKYERSSEETRLNIQQFRNRMEFVAEASHPPSKWTQ